MGLLKKNKVQAVTDEARKAWDAGDSRLVVRYWDEVMAFQGTGAIAGAADAIESAESVGWKLEHASYAWVSEKKRGVEVFIFGRPEL
jgi:hypothetical protein